MLKISRNNKIDSIKEELETLAGNMRYKAKGCPEYIADFKRKGEQKKLRKEIYQTNRARGKTSGIYWSLAVIKNYLSSNIGLKADEDYWDIMSENYENSHKSIEDLLIKWNQEIGKYIQISFQEEKEINIVDEVVHKLAKKASLIREYISPAEELIEYLRNNYYFNEKMTKDQLWNKVLLIIQLRGFVEGIYLALGDIKMELYKEKDHSKKINEKNYINYWNPFNEKENINEILERWENEDRNRMKNFEEKNNSEII